MCESKPGVPNPVPLTPETYNNQAHPDNDVEHIANVDGDNKVSEQAIQHRGFRRSAYDQRELALCASRSITSSARAAATGSR